MSGIFEQIAALSEGVMRASQLSDKQQDAKKDDKAAGIDWNMNSIINSELIEPTLNQETASIIFQITALPSGRHRSKICITDDIVFAKTEESENKSLSLQCKYRAI